MKPSRNLRKFIRDLKRHSYTNFGWQREKQLPEVDRTINRRAKLMSDLDRCTEDGLVGRITMGCDCDGHNYHHEVIIKRPECLVSCDRDIEQSYYWADGPSRSVFFVRPFAVRERRKA